jgi:hypothetical protein
VSRPRRAPAPPLRLRLRSGTAARPQSAMKRKTANPTARGATSSVRAGASTSGRNDRRLARRHRVPRGGRRAARARRLAPGLRAVEFAL